MLGACAVGMWATAPARSGTATAETQQWSMTPTGVGVQNGCDGRAHGAGVRGAATETPPSARDLHPLSALDLSNRLHGDPRPQGVA